MSAHVLGNYDAFLIDIDGVLVRGTSPIDGASGAFLLLAEAGDVLLLTNNSTRSRAEHASRLAELGFGIDAEQVIASSYLAASYLLREFGPLAAWVIGEEGLREELQAAGHTLSESPEKADVLVVGMDRKLTYDALAAGLAALQAGARFVATNDDGTYPVAETQLPGAGAMVGALRGMGFEPDIVLGKPSPIPYRAALRATGSNAKRTLMIGDRLETDIAGARTAGLDSALVLSGISSRQDIDTTGIRPTWIAEDLSALVCGRAERLVA